MPPDPGAVAIAALRVWHCNYVSLAPVAQYQNLRTLLIASTPTPT